MGHHNRHFAGDRYALSGAWSPPSSKANFCEEDYLVSFYLAEFMNSLTNLFYIYYALKFMYGPGNRGLLRPRVDSMSLSLFVLGIGSFLFHASLRQTMQFADELAMLGLAWSLLQGSLNVRNATVYDRMVKAALAIAFPLFSAFYIWTGKIIYHASAFAIIVALITARAYYVFHWCVPSFPEAKIIEWRVRARNALLFLLIGYGLWNVDLECCAELRRLRAYMGLPWAWLFEMHGWWHTLTAVSASEAMNIVREVQEEVDRANEKEKAT